MNIEELKKMLLMIQRPIPWDPVPPWLKLSKDKIKKFNDIQIRLNAKIAVIEDQKKIELGKLAGIPIK
jgi:hypothetical protein